MNGDENDENDENVYCEEYIQMFCEQNQCMSLMIWMYERVNDLRDVIAKTSY
jgi:hypothetical protein